MLKLNETTDLECFKVRFHIRREVQHKCCNWDDLCHKCAEPITEVLLLCEAQLPASSPCKKTTDIINSETRIQRPVAAAIGMNSLPVTCCDKTLSHVVILTSLM
jgi:hypothetical protein